MSKNLKEITSCEVCGNAELHLVLNLGNHPMCDDLVPIDSPRVCEEYPIQILLCKQCITAHQRYQIPKKELFPASYHYRSSLTADVLNGMKELVEACTKQLKNLKDLKVLDIGCNDGSLLSFFAKQGAKTFGIEPTGAAKDAIKNGHFVINDFISEDVAKQFVLKNGQPEVITFTNVFAHIEDLHSVIRALKILSSSKTIIVIENHYLGSVLQKNQFDTFYHEHPRTYSYSSFVYIANSLGMNITNVEFPKRYGGNIRVFISHIQNITLQNSKLSELDKTEQLFTNGLQQLSLKIEKWRIKKLAEIQAEILHYGILPAKAFPGRAAILIKMLNLDEKQISAVYEKPASGKIGHYLPGTRIPIKSDDDFVDDGRPILNLAWHISDEIKSYIESRGHKTRIINIISDEDF